MIKLKIHGFSILGVGIVSKLDNDLLQLYMLYKYNKQFQTVNSLYSHVCYSRVKFVFQFFYFIKKKTKTEFYCLFEKLFAKK